MDKLFLSVLNMSLTGAFVIAAICIVRLPLKMAPKIISYCLWAVAGFRLVFPFSIESIFSLMPIKPQSIPPDIAMQTIPRVDSGIPFVNNAVSGMLPASGDFGTVSVNPLQVWTAIGAYVWIIGVAAMLIYSVVSIVLLNRGLRGAASSRENIFESTDLKTPLVIGLFHPKIYIPAGLSDGELRYILLHEQTHIRRRDYIVKMLAYFVLCLHWFNPLVWVAFVLMGADMEMSCDERVLKELGGDIQDDYSMSLVRIAAGRLILNGSPLAFGEGGMKERIKRVLYYKKPSLIIMLVSVALVVALSVGFAVDRTVTNDDISEYRLLTNLGYTKELVQSVINGRAAFSIDNSNIGDIVKALPVQHFRKFDSFTTDYITNEIYIKYEPYDEDVIIMGNGLDPFPAVTNKNNALLLFAYLDGLEKVTFATLLYDPPGTYDEEIYFNDYLSEPIGQIKPQRMNLSELYAALGVNIYLSEFYFAHYSRIYLGVESEQVSYRNEEPDEIKRQPDGSIVWIYYNLGQVYSISTGSFVNPGYTAMYYFDIPRAIIYDELSGRLYATRFIHADNYGKTYDYITDLFGYPSVIKDIGGDKYIAYTLDDKLQQKYAYFVLHNDIVIEEGVMYGNDYSALEIHE